MVEPIAQHQLALLGLNLLAAGIFTFKCCLLMLVQMWVRWTFPRPRIDQVLFVCIKVLLPLACLLLVGAGLWQLFVPERAGVPWVDYQPWHASDWIGHGSGIAWVTQIILAVLAIAFAGNILAWMAYAFVSGRADHRRLSEAELI
jgi:hypothetical protein